MDRWRAQARKAVRQYPALLKSKELTDIQQKDMYAISRALDTINRRYGNADIRFRLIELCYWQKTFTIDGAAAALHISIQTARGWDRDFIYLVDAYRHS